MKHLKNIQNKSTSEKMLIEKFFTQINSLIRINLIAVFFLSSFFSINVNADEKSDFKQLDTIEALSDRDNKEGLKQLLEFKSKFTSQTSDKVRLETLQTLVYLYYDAGQVKASEEVINEYQKLAEKLQNKNSIAIAKISKTFKILDNGNPELAISKLKEIEKSLTGNESPVVFRRLNSAYGVMYRIAGKFDQALEHYLIALTLADQLPRRKIESKLYTLEAIANLYYDMKDEEKALATTKEAIAISPLANSPKTLVSLTMLQGLILANLGRNDESLLAYKKVLQLSIDSSMPGTETTALSNISDHYLIAKDFKNAEIYARQAISNAEKFGEKASVITPKINLGFALMGQGKVAPGLALVKEGLQFYKDAHSVVDLEAITLELAISLERAGMYKEALETLHEHRKLSNELFRSDRASAVAGLQEKFNATEREKQIELLGKENDLKDADIKNRHLQQIVTLLGTVITVLVGIFVFLLYRKVRKTNEELQKANKQLEFHAVRDPLTGLHNRRSFVEMMKSRSTLVENDRRENKSNDLPDCLILMDIDLFKQINDTWGHSVGDIVLKEVATRLTSCVRETDMVLRWGGEEFLIYSPKSSSEQITKLVERVLATIGNSMIQVGDLQIPVTITAGFISLPFSGVSEENCGWKKTLQMADMALYLGKAHGRNRAYGLSKLLVDHDKAMSLIDHDLSAAISEGMVELIEVIGPLQIKTEKTNSTKKNV